MAGDDIVQKITITTEGADEALAAFKKVGDAADKASESIAKAGEGGGDGLAKAGEAAASAADGFAKVGEAASGIGDKLSTLGEAVSGIGDKLSKIGQAGDGLSKIGDAATKVGDSISKVGEAATVAGSSIASVGQAVTQAGQGLAQAGTAATQAASGVEQVGQAATAASAGLSQIGQAAQQAGDGFAKIGDQAAKAADGLKQAGDASEQAATHASASGAAAEQSSHSWGSFVLEIGKVGIEIISFGVSVAKIVDYFSGAKVAAEATSTAFKAFNIAATSAEFIAFGNTLAGIAPILGTIGTAVLGLVPGLAGMAAGFTTTAVAATGLTAVLGALGLGVAVVVVGFKLISAIADEVAAGLKKIGEAIAASFDPAPFVKITTSLEKLSATTGQSFDSLQRGKAAFAELGFSAEQFGSIITKINDQMASFDVGAKIKESGDKVLQTEQAMLEAQLKVEQLQGSTTAFTQARLDVVKQLEGATNDLTKAEEAASKAGVEHAKAVANSLSAIIPIVKQIEEGQKNIKFDDLVTAQTKIDAVTASMKKAGESGKTAAEVLNEFIANADRASAIKVGAAFDISADQVDRVRQLKDNVKDIFDRAQAAPPLISPTSKAAFDSLRQSTVELEQAQIRLQQAWDSTVFARFGATYEATLNRMKTAVISWAAAALEAFNKFTEGVGTAISTIPAATEATLAQIKSAWFSTWAAIADFVGGVLQKIPGLGGIGDQFKQIAADWKRTAENASQDQQTAQQKIVDAWKNTANDVKKSADDVSKVKIDSSAIAEASKVVDLFHDSVVKWDDVAKKAQETGLSVSEILRQLGTTSKDGAQGVDAFSNALDKIKAPEPVKIPAPDNSAVQPKVDESNKALASIGDQKLTPAKVPAPDDSGLLSKIQELGSKFLKLFDMSAGAAEFDQQLNKVEAEAKDKGQQINDDLKIKPDVDPSGAGGFSGLVQAAEKAANEIEAVFHNIKPEFSGSLNFDSVIDSARSAANEIEAIFQNIHPQFSGSLDFNSMIIEAQNAAQQMAQAFSNIIIPPPAPPDFSGVISAAQSAAQQIAEIFASVLSQVSTAGAQIQTAVSNAQASLQTAQQAASDATDAAQRAADAASQAADSASAANASADEAEAAAQRAANARAQAGGNAWGGLITGPGSGTSDSILSWLSNGEFVMRAAAVQKYGVGLFDLFNNLRFPLDGFHAGGLNQISFSPRITLPAFAGGGIVRAAGPTQQSTRTINLTIGDQTFKGFTAPEDTAKALERAAISRQASSTGLRPRWNK